MVVFIDLEEHEDVVSGNDIRVDPFDMHDLIGAHTYYNNTCTLENDDTKIGGREDERPNPNLNAFSAALGCYPIVVEIAKSLDLNSLHDLSQTCRQFRANLLQYRNQLIPQTLRCESEDYEPLGRLGNVLRENTISGGNDANDWSNSTVGRDGVRINRMTTGRKVGGTCARDMVGECRRCGTVVCRNCIIKAPQATALKARHRRMCRTCLKAPVTLHTVQHHESEEATDEPLHFEEPPRIKPPTHRSPCTCAPNTIWICQPCGLTLRTNDTTYLRGWTWRSRYSTQLHGLGTGIGEGVEGVQCGRESSCLSSRLLFKEIECGSDSVASEQRNDARSRGEGGSGRASFEAGGHTDSVAAAMGQRSGGYRGHERVGGSYHLQEIEGIGGVVKRKRKRKIRVGQVVREYEDERESGRYLKREQEGLNRSWCSWCRRVVMSNRDLVGLSEGKDRGGEDGIGRSLGSDDSGSSLSM